ncbi:hypothetical protein C6P46_003619 [Rhodotorula mucilaginosa]|uniref:Adhesion regulating molecule n=1 Tax=Rhodotorula mucilaginosa TaxID=5537 RepID=A0A9P7B932_RHOMI|nr:hypothetical protein C6P46_003619 [Rhodotorula mucilaginosa]
MSGQRLLQFRAGRAVRQGDSNTVTPQPQRGLVYIQEEDDGLLHFCYKDLATGQLEDDLIIFPGDASFHDVNDRVQVLKFNSSSARHFYWHQDPQLDPQQFKRTRDEVNRLIGAAEEDDEPAAGTMDLESESGSGTTADVAMSDASQPQLPTSTSTSSQPAATATAQPRQPQPQPPLGQADQLAQLQNILAGLGGSGSGGGGSGGGGVPEYTLTDVLTPSAASSLISSSSLSDSALSHLSTSYLPPSLPTSSPSEQRASLLRAVSSPEFRRALASLERALRTGATGPLVQGLGMPLRAASGTEEFLEEVQKQAEKEKEGESKS